MESALQLILKPGSAAQRNYLCSMVFSQEELKELLEEKYDQYNTIAFIDEDPVAVPHMFSRREDIEIAGFLAATIAWGQRPTIIRNARHLLQLMDNSPYDFVINACRDDLASLGNFKHRTFNGQDAIYFVKSLHRLYHEYGGLERVFSQSWSTHEGSMGSAITAFRELFVSGTGAGRTAKHIADPSRGSSAKRINMFLRWMVRNDGRGVDFGLWRHIPASGLCCPLDVHTGNMARALGLLTRNTNDWKAVEELTSALRSFDPMDPVKYDFALFGMGMYDKLI